MTQTKHDGKTKKGVSKGLNFFVKVNANSTKEDNREKALKAKAILEAFFEDSVEELWMDDDDMAWGVTSYD